MSEDPRTKEKLAETAQALLSGKIPAIEGAREILRLWYQAGLPPDDDDITPFVAVDSETDALPLGRVRELWAPDALAKLQPEIDRAEQWARETILPHCERVIERAALSTKEK
jgi:hypothetical protein